MLQDQIKTNIIIADSQFLIVEALKQLLGNDERFIITGVVSNLFNLETLLNLSKDGILIVDIHSIDIGSVHNFKNLMSLFPGFRVLILTNEITKTDFVELSKAGFRNIEYKTTCREDFFLALDLCLKGKNHYPPELLDLILEMNSANGLPEENRALTNSEIEIVRLISQGLTTKEIADRKNVSFHTVNTHRKNIFRKMGVSNVSELIMNAIKSGWIDTIEYYI